jgi:hypothetical protein
MPANIDDLFRRSQAMFRFSTECSGIPRPHLYDGARLSIDLLKHMS